MGPRHEQLAPTVDSASALPLIQGITQLHDAVLLMDADGRVLWVSDALAAICGGAHEGQPWVSLLVDGAAGRGLVERLESNGRLSNEPVKLLRSDGSSVTASVSAARLGSRAEPCPSVAILRLGRSTFADPAFHDTREMLSSILDGFPDGVVVVDRSRFITYANPVMEQLIGYRPDEILDKPLALLIRRSEDLERIAAALDPGQPVRNQDLELRRRDGSPLCVSVSASVMRLPDGSVVGTVAYLRDVTERRAAERSLARKNDELEHYVNAVSHDLRSPLVSLLGFTRLLREDYGERLDEQGIHFLHRVEQAGRNMEHLIHDLLELSRIGRSGADMSLVDPKTVLLQLNAELKPRLDAAHVGLELPADPPLLCCDRTRLYQLFSNLVGNALDHMGPVPEPRVHVEITEEADAHLIRVSDNGRGVDPQHHATIFEIFKSLGPRADGRRGTGIGLAIVKKIAETQGGAVRIASNLGEGASFQVTLPRPTTG